MKTGIELIAEERRRQIEVEGWTAERDAQYVDESLAFAAACYAIPPRGRNIYAGAGGHSNVIRVLWSWDQLWWKPTPDNRIRELQKAGALIAAEIDRLQREKLCRCTGIVHVSTDENNVQWCLFCKKEVE